jgi:hypothetical protein
MRTEGATPSTGVPSQAFGLAASMERRAVLQLKFD